MRRATRHLVLLLACACALAAPAASQDHGDGGHGATPVAGAHVRIGFDAMRPARIDVVTGDRVNWTNDAARVHTVTADNDSFDSGRLSSAETYSRRFTAPGEAPYHCKLHPTIRGVVNVHDLLLNSPGQSGAPGKPYPLRGRSALPVGTPVALEADAGAGFAPVAFTTVDDQGTFDANVVPQTTTTYRAVAGDMTSRAVQLTVLDRRIALTVRRLRGGRVRLRADVAPPTRSGRVVLQFYLPQRFGWWPTQRAKLDRASGATFTLHQQRRLRARVRYTLADGATALATSRIVRVGPPAESARAGHDHG